MRALILVATTVLALAACEGVAQEPPVMDDDRDACGASALQGLIGQPEAVLQGMTFGGPLRVIRPGQAVTMDYSAARLNVTLDAGGVIVEIACG